MSKLPYGYLAGDIMSFGSKLARQYEYEEFEKREIPVDVYSPILNKSINDKSNVTEEENNHLAEKITQADIDRMWKSDFVVIEPSQSAIGSMCEMGTLFGWKYLADKLEEETKGKTDAEALEIYRKELKHQQERNVFPHYFDIRTNGLNEKNWRRSFSINQLLYGMVLYTAKNGDFESFDEILDHLEELYKK